MRRRGRALRRRYGRSTGGALLWNIYINGPRGRREEDAVVHERVPFPGTTRSDGRYVTLEAAKKYRVSEGRILALPSPGQDRWR